MPGGRLTFNFTGSTLGADTIRWMRDGVQVGWDPTFTLTAADVGHQFTVTHIVTHAGDLVEKTSQAVTIVPNTVTNLATPVVTGTAMVGGRLTTAGAGATGATYSYQWLRNAAPITGATAASYILTSSDLAAQLTVRLTASRFGQSMAKTSAPVTVAPNLVTSLRTPVISGSAKVGQTLSAVPIGATGATFTYQWYRSGTAITGATGPTRTLTASEYGKVMTVTVTATYLGQTASEDECRHRQGCPRRVHQLGASIHVRHLPAGLHAESARGHLVPDPVHRPVPMAAQRHRHHWGDVVEIPAQVRRPWQAHLGASQGIPDRLRHTGDVLPVPQDRVTGHSLRRPSMEGLGTSALI